MYLDVYKWFTETSGLGLAEQSARLMNPSPAKREDEIAERVEEWVQKCDRLARYGDEFRRAFDVLEARNALALEELKDTGLLQFGSQECSIFMQRW